MPRHSRHTLAPLPTLLLILGACSDSSTGPETEPEAVPQPGPSRRSAAARVPSQLGSHEVLQHLQLHCLVVTPPVG